MSAPASPVRQPPVVREADAILTSRLAEDMGVSPILAQLMIHRGVTDADAAQAFLFGHDLQAPEDMDEMVEAAEIVAEAVRREAPILVHGDYDVDGVTGTALLVWALRELGGRADPYVPHRTDEGYGLSREGIEQAHRDGYGLLVSVDCGSSSPEEIELAHSLGMCVVITDHHLVGARPPADAFVNPRGPGVEAAFPHYAGAGVAYQLARAVARNLGQEEPEGCLDLAALGTVGDVMPLVGDNRVIVRAGLEVMQGMTRPGLAALIRVAGLEGGILSGEKPLTARSLSHALAPRINACGRLDHARLAVDLLLEDDTARAAELALEVDRVNTRRREAEAAVREEAEARVASQGDGPRVVIVEASADWLPGLVGITAGRLAERYGVPAFIMSILEDGTARGSVRAPAHVDVFACLSECRDLFSHFGGHRRAGGFTIQAADIDTLRSRLLEIVPRLSGIPEPSVQVDMRLDLDTVNLELVDELEQLAPHGAGNPIPLFLAEGRELAFPEKVKDAHLRFQAPRKGQGLRCMAFQRADLFPLIGSGRRYGLVFEIEGSSWNGMRRAELIVRDVLDSEGRLLGAVGSTGPQPTSPPPADQRATTGEAPAEVAPRPSAAQSSVGTSARSSSAGPPPDEPRADEPRADVPRVEEPRVEEPRVEEPRVEEPRVEEPPQPTRGPRTSVLDARAHPNKGRYLADLVDEGRPVLVIVRKGLEAFVAGVVAGGRDLAPPPNMVVRNWSQVGASIAEGQETRLPERFQDVALFTPPPFVQTMRPLLTGPARCHVVFGSEDLDEEERLMKSLLVTREMVEWVFRALRTHGETFGAPQCRRVASELAARRVTPDAVRVCVRVLCEMGVARRRDDGSYEWTGQKGSLEESRTFQKYSTLLATFRVVRQIFDGGTGLEERLHAGVDDLAG